MTNAIAPQRPADIVSPIADSAMPNTVTLADARQAGRVGLRRGQHLRHRIQIRCRDDITRLMRTAF
ncbi:hypothetical protein OKW43_008208 [Paraburkholderia sp. WC7.3g]|uniref:hypothetical protein n=1 Tax=Paraburkholderia sp. WC7.3g TaxID=2991070 RepID=UPI003D20D317